MFRPLLFPNHSQINPFHNIWPIPLRSVSVTDSLHLSHSSCPLCADLPTNNSIPLSSHSRTYVSHFQKHELFNTRSHAILEARMSSKTQFLANRAKIRLQNSGGNYQTYANHNNSYVSPDVIFDCYVHTEGIVIVSEYK